jgi:hypothetical protein
MADSKKYWDEAERLRREAEDSHDPDLRRTMLDIAGLHDRMAETLTKRRPEPKTAR